MVCNDPAQPVSAVQVALLVILAAVLIYYIMRILGGFGKGREGFVSKKAQEIYTKAQEVFVDGGGDARYSEYKNKVPHADPVQYKDVRKLYKEGRMTPESVQGVI